MLFVLACAYSFALGACFAAVAYVRTSDWRRIRREQKRREFDARVNLGRLAMREEHGRTLLAATPEIRRVA